MKGNIKLSGNITKKQKSNGGGGGGGTQKSGTGNKRELRKEKSSRLALWQIKCIALKKVPPTLGGPWTKTFMMKYHPGFVTKSKPFHWFKHHHVVPAHLCSVQGW